MEIRVQSRDIEKALRILKKKLQVDGIFGELKKRRFYEKPSVKKKRKQMEAEKRKRKLLRRSSRPFTGSKPKTGPIRPAGETGRPQTEEPR